MVEKEQKPSAHPALPDLNNSSHPAGGPPVEKPVFYLKPSRKLWIWVLKSEFFFLRSSTFRIEWITVE